MTDNTRSQIYSVDEDNPDEQAERPLFIEGVEHRPDGSVRVDGKGVEIAEGVFVRHNSSEGQVEVYFEETDATAFIQEGSDGDLLGSANGGEFVDTNGDGTAVLQSNAADFDGNPAQNLAEPSADTDAARKTEVDSKADDPHGDGSHSLEYIDDGDGVKRQFWVIPAGGTDPEGADPEDIIFEEES